MKGKMRSIKQSFGLLMITALLAGCAGLDPGADPVVVRAEQSAQIATDTFDVFLKFEYENSDLLKKITPEFHKAAELIRRNGKGWILTLRNVTKSYKQNRTPENKANVATALATVDRALQEVQTWLVGAQQASIAAMAQPTPVPAPLVLPEAPAKPPGPGKSFTPPTIK